MTPEFWLDIARKDIEMLSEGAHVRRTIKGLVGALEESEREVARMAGALREIRDTVWPEYADIRPTSQLPHRVVAVAALAQPTQEETNG